MTALLLGCSQSRVEYILQNMKDNRDSCTSNEEYTLYHNIICEMYSYLADNFGVTSLN